MLNLDHSLWLLNMYYHLNHRARFKQLLSSSSERNLFSANQSSDKLSNSASQSKRGKLKKAAFNLCLLSYTCITL